MSNKKDLQALAENLVEEFYETQGAGVLKNLNKRTYGNLINGREDVLNSMKESLSDYTDEEGKEIGEKEKEEILHLVDREIWGYGIIDDLIHDITQEYNMTTIINTHDMNSVLGIGEKVIYIYEGHKEWEGTKDDIFTSTNERLNNFIFASDLLRKVKDVEVQGMEG